MSKIAFVRGGTRAAVQYGDRVVLLVNHAIAVLYGSPVVGK